MNYFAFFPALANAATNPHADAPATSPTRRVRAATSSPRSAARASRSSPTRKNKDEAMQVPGVVQSRTTTQKKWAELGGYTAARRCSKSDGVPERDAVQQGVLRDRCQIVKDFWAVPEYADLLTQLNERLLSVRRRRQGHGQGGARRAAERLERDLQQLRRSVSESSATRPAARRSCLPSNARNGGGTPWDRDHHARPHARARRPAAGATSRSGTSSSSRRSLS